MKLCFMCGNEIKGKVYHLDTEEVCINCYEESMGTKDRTSWLDDVIDYGNV